MPSKTAKAEGVAVSDKDPNATANPQTETALTTTREGDVAGPLALALSSDATDRILAELSDALHRIEEGFGNLTAPGAIAVADRPFVIVDAMTVDDFVDKTTGETKVKHIFKLQFPDGDVKLTMQSDAGPRRILADAFRKARLVGHTLTVGPYKYVKKTIPGQIQAAYIFEQQPGFRSALN